MINIINIQFKVQLVQKQQLNYKIIKEYINSTKFDTRYFDELLKFRKKNIWYIEKNKNSKL